MPDPGSPKMKSSVVVLGAGVSGLSVGLELQSRGYGVTLLERNEVGAESSWAGGGILSPLLPWDYSESLSKLALRSMACYESWVNGIESQSGNVTEFTRCGMSVQGIKKPGPALAWCRKHNFAAQPGRTRANDSLWLPDIAQVRNPLLVAALREAVLKLGGTIHTHCAAEAVITRARRIVAVQTTQGTFSADRFVLATGAWAGIGLPGLAGVPHVRPIRGQMLLFKLKPGVLDSILYRNGLYLIPRRDGHVLVGSTVEDAGFDKSTDAATLQRLHAEAAKMLPVLSTMQPIRHWAGLRPGSPGNIPVIGPHPDFDNVFINTGHYRYGVTMAPASAALLLDLMEGNTPELDPTPYSWQAALARTWTDAL